MVTPGPSDIYINCLVRETKTVSLSVSSRSQTPPPAAAPAGAARTHTRPHAPCPWGHTESEIRDRAEAGSGTRGAHKARGVHITHITHPCGVTRSIRVAHLPSNRLNVEAVSREALAAHHPPRAAAGLAHDRGASHGQVPALRVAVRARRSLRVCAELAAQRRAPLPTERRR